MESGVPEAAVEEMQMPLFLQTQNNTGSCWVVINQVRDTFYYFIILYTLYKRPATPRRSS